MEQYIVVFFCLSEAFRFLTDNNHLACDDNYLEITIHQLTIQVPERDLKPLGCSCTSDITLEFLCALLIGLSGFSSQADKKISFKLNV